MARLARSRRGMTLIEVMISVGIVLAISTIGWASVQDAIELGDVLAANDDTTRGARVTLDRLKRQLQLAYLTPHRVGGAQDQFAANAGQTNDSTATTIIPTYTTVFVGQSDDPDRIWFSTLAHQRLYRNSRECDQAEVTVWADRAKKDQGLGNVLYHRESQRIDGEPDEDGRVWPLAYNVRSFSLRYLDHVSNEWYDEWDSRGAETPYRLPRAVQIGMVMMAPDPEDEDRTVDMPFLTTVVLEYASPVAPKTGPNGALPLAGGF